MARREGEEISAGSMADIAFLLLIFFIVTTTMELEAGIGQTLAKKIPVPDGWIPPDVNKRDVFAISVNKNDDLLIEDELHAIEEIQDLLYDYFTANMNAISDDNVDWASYKERSLQDCELSMKIAEGELAKSPEDLILKSKVRKWKDRVLVCTIAPTKKFMQINENAVIQIKQKSKSSYGTYISIQNEVKSVINRVRDEKCKEYFNGLSYYDLDLELEEDQEKLKILRILVPEKIIEPPIIN
jgi:biopolymer transport protein ExbD